MINQLVGLCRQMKRQRRHPRKVWVWRIVEVQLRTISPMQEGRIPSLARLTCRCYCFLRAYVTKKLQQSQLRCHAILHSCLRNNDPVMMVTADRCA